MRKWTIPTTTGRAATTFLLLFALAGDVFAQATPNPDREKAQSFRDEVVADAKWVPQSGVKLTTTAYAEDYAKRYKRPTPPDGIEEFRGLGARSRLRA